jgi:wobble nucleotide-excising tRNase
MSIIINLSNHPDKFTANCQEFEVEKRVNFIFGKNGTGKSTIAKEIHNQFSNDYDVCVFQDFEGVVENSRLNAVALGATNTAIQKKIDGIDKEISSILKETEQPNNKYEDTLFTRAEKSQKAFGEQDKKIKKFYTTAASRIKNIKNPSIANPSYNTKDFQADIIKACALSDEAVSAYKKIIKADRKSDISPMVFSGIDLSSYVESTNDILQSSVTQPQKIPGLDGNTEKQAFARQGMNIHKHIAGEKCAFCGNEISDERWQLLGAYFSDEVKKLEERINSELLRIESGLLEINDTKEMHTLDFYEQFLEDAKEANSQIKAKVNEYNSILTLLKTALETKRKSPFTKTDPLKIDLPPDFSGIKKMCNDIVDAHKKFSRNLDTEQRQARDALRYHEVQKEMSLFKYVDENIKLTVLSGVNDEAQKNLNTKKNELKIKQDERKTLIQQTKDEGKIAEKINVLLNGMGVVAFSLKLVSDDEEGQRGQYQIKGYDKKIRPITELSKGEKNIIAFLYFIFSLESAEHTSRRKIIVLDDPMTSNDDTMQYLMTEQVRKLYVETNSNNFFVLLTHNLHFYLNVRPNYNEAEENKIIKRNIRQTDDSKKEKTYYEKNGYFVLKRNGIHTFIQPIKTHNEDFRTSYAALWEDLIFLYNNDKPVSMLNNCRRIIETYMKFNGLEQKFYNSNEFVRKLFNVNSHSIDDQENELNGKTKDEIRIMLYELFKDNNAEEHFNNYWERQEV